MCAAPQRPDNRPATVFVVDDHTAMRSMIRIACEQTPGLEVVGEAADGATALVQIRELKPDVVVLDLMLPGVSGLDIVRTLRNEGSTTRCLVLTARDDPESLFDAVRADAAGYLDKSTDIPVLVEAIEAVAAGDSIITEGQHQQAARQLGAFVRQTRDSSRAAAMLSGREVEILGLIKEALTTRQMATRLGLSARTVESHISSIYKKLKVRSRVQAVSKAEELGVLSDSLRRTT
jgi:DNA-binding NarL/FixJ family response regulator